jgi:acetolactate synthase-1/2/3 large subunit
MWAAQYLGFEDPNRWMTSGGLGTMGYGLPASIGVQIAHPDALVINVAGEASWLMNMQEMGTAVQYRLPVKQFILNNERLGMVRQWQELLHGERYSHSGPRPCPISSSWPRPSAARASCARTPPISTTRSWRCWTMTAR